MGSYRLGLRRGTYWGSARTSPTTSCPVRSTPRESSTEALAETRTRLKELDTCHQQRLINWGYVISDTAVRKWVKPGFGGPDRLPYPQELGWVANPKSVCPEARRRRRVKKVGQQIIRRRRGGSHASLLADSHAPSKEDKRPSQESGEALRRAGAHAAGTHLLFDDPTPIQLDPHDGDEESDYKVRAHDVARTAPCATSTSNRLAAPSYGGVVRRAGPMDTQSRVVARL